MSKSVALALLALLSGQALALDGLTLTTTLQLQRSKFSAPTAPYKSRGATASASVFKALDNKTFVGGSLAYGESRTNPAANSGRVENEVASVSAFVMRDIGSGLLLDVNLGYGKVALDNAYLTGATRVSYNADTDFLLAGIGITKIVPISPNLSGTLTARYSYVDNTNKSYTDSTGARQSGSDSTRNIVAVGGGLQGRYGNWMPNASLNWNTSNTEFGSGTGDRSYFSYAIGSGYALDRVSRMGISYSGVVNKAHTRESGFSVSYTTRF